MSKKVGQWKIEYHVAVAPSLDPIPQAVLRQRISKRRTPDRGRRRWSRSRWANHRRERNGSGWDQSGPCQNDCTAKRRTLCDGNVNILLTTLKERGRSFKCKTQSRKRHFGELFLSIWQIEIDGIKRLSLKKNQCPRRRPDLCFPIGGSPCRTARRAGPNMPSNSAAPDERRGRG